MRKHFSQPIVVENRPAAGGTPGTEFVAQNGHDGYTLLLGGIAGLALIPPVHQGPLYGRRFCAARPDLAFAAGVCRSQRARREQPWPNSSPREGQSGQADVRLGGHRHRDASGRRAAATGSRNRTCPCAVPQHRQFTYRSDGRSISMRSSAMSRSCSRMWKATPSKHWPLRRRSGHSCCRISRRRKRRGYRRYGPRSGMDWSPLRSPQLLRWSGSGKRRWLLNGTPNLQRVRRNMGSAHRPKVLKVSAHSLSLK